MLLNNIKMNKMANENDFFKNDAENISEYWRNKLDKGADFEDSTLRYFPMVYNNEERRLNKGKALKDMSEYIVGTESRYTSILSFEEESGDIIRKIEKLDNGQKMKDHLVETKMESCLNSFIKTGNKDIEKMKSGKYETDYLNHIVNSVVMLKDKILNNISATSLLEEMKEVPAFKKEYDLIDQRVQDKKELMSNIEDDHFCEWVSSMNDFYGVKDLTEIPAGNDKASIEYRASMLPIIDKMVDLLDRVNLSDKKHIEIYSSDMSETDLAGISKIRNFLSDYPHAKKEYERNLEISSLMNKSNVDIVKNLEPEIIKNTDNKYKVDLDYIDAVYDKIGKESAGYSLSRRTMDVINMKDQINSLPNNVSDDNDRFKINEYKEKIKNHDLILLDDFNGLSKNIKSLKGQEFFNDFKSVFYSEDSTSVKKDLKAITDVVDRIEKKYGSNGLPDFNSSDSFNFIKYKKLADEFKASELTEDFKSKNNIKQQITN